MMRADRYCNGYFTVSTVSPEDIVITSPSNISASRGDNVTFTCQTDAGPNTTYLWLYNIVDVVCIQSNCSMGIFAFNASSQGKFE